MRSSAATLVVLLLCVTGCSSLPRAGTSDGTPSGFDSVASTVQPLNSAPDATSDLALLGNAIGNRQVVLLGENGHGVAEFTTAKVRIVRYLHEKRGFDVVAFESGFHECREANERLTQRPAADAIEDCLIVQLHHAEVKPLFEYAARTLRSARPLAIAGVDLQVQGRSSRTRPTYFKNALDAVKSPIAEQLALLDAAFIEKNFGSVEERRNWVRENGQQLKALYDSAAAVTSRDVQWTLEGASELIRREIMRGEALSKAEEIPAAVYEIRDEWMARSIMRLTREGPRRRKVVVWLHNDHARYGEWQLGTARIRATGQFLRRSLGSNVFSIAFFMGSGTFADNFRRERPVATPPSASVEETMARAGFPLAFLNISATKTRAVRTWAEAEHPYVRGSSIETMRPGREFDALIFVRHASPPSYRLRP